MDIDKFEYIIRVAEEKSFTKAAAKLYVSQPALSQYVSSLEDQFKIKFFDRSVTPLKLTLAGEIFLKKSLKIMELKKELWKELEDIGENLIGNISIGISINRTSYILPKFFSDLKNKFPKIRIEIIEKNGYELENEVVNGQVDIAIISLPLFSNELDYIEFFEEELILVKSKYDNYLDNKKVVNLNDFKNEKFILLKEKQKFRTVVEAIFLKNNFFPNIYLETESQECILEMVSQGIGVGFTSNMMLDNNRWKDKLIGYSLGEDIAKRKFGIVFKKRKKLNNVEKYLVDLITLKF